MFLRSVKATNAERSRELPGDALISEPIGSLTNAITIHVRPHEVWPWLAQMGAGRAGWYNYDFHDHDTHPSADSILPEFQKILVGTTFPWRPGAPEGFTVFESNPVQSLVLGSKASDRHAIVTWAFVLEPLPNGETRLIVRLRAGRDYQFHGLPSWIIGRIVPQSHFVMQRQQLLSIARRAEDLGPLAYAPQVDFDGAATDSAAPARSGLRSAARAVAGGAGLAAGMYAAYAAIKWIGLGQAARKSHDQTSHALDESTHVK
jgi:hypothetical protein